MEHFFLFHYFRFMVYKVIGLMSGSSLDGLDIAFVHFQEQAGKWDFELIHSACYHYDQLWSDRLQAAQTLSAFDYQLLNTSFGHYIGSQVNHFIRQKGLEYQVQLIVSHGHTVFHAPQKKMTAQLGDGASIAAETGINTITDLRAMDIALGGQGAPIVPIGEEILLGKHDFYLNLGGIANLSGRIQDRIVAFDVCPANRVLNLLAQETGKAFDEDGRLAASGSVDDQLLNTLNAQGYYRENYPKSLPNSFGTETIFRIIKDSGCSPPNGARTFVEHIAVQIKNAIQGIVLSPSATTLSLFATGGGAHNIFLVKKIAERLIAMDIRMIIPDKNIIDFKEAIIMAFIGVLRWREENNVLSSVTGARRSSIGGAVWIGAEA
jgi:anhydro-N-acetylmuramic acid kinase